MLINGKTPEQIKSWMRCCSVATACHGCTYNRKDYCFSEAVLPNALAYIERLEQLLAVLGVSIPKEDKND